MKKTLLYLFFLVFGTTLFAQSPTILSDSSKISLITCGPGEHLYAKFGHTAIRVMDKEQDIDIVFNYGSFDFDTEGFYIKFIKGITDYSLSIDFTYNFIIRYSLREIVVWEQELSLKQQEKQWFFDVLMKNYEPENREYRYNFVYDNCTTRPRDMIEFALNEKIKYPSIEANESFRQLVGQYVGTNSWEKFGIDFVLGSEADKVATQHERMFLPIELKDNLQEATRVDGEPLVAKLSTPVDLPLKQVEKPSITPLSASIMLLLLVVLISYFGRNMKMYYVDGILFAVAGVLGCIIFFLDYISLHPLVGGNFNLLWLNPLQLLFALLLPFKKLRKSLVVYQILNALAIIVALAGFIFLPQQFNIAFMPLMIALLIRAAIFVRYQQIFGK